MIILPDLNSICCSPVTCCDTIYHNLQIKMIGHLCFHAKLSHSSQACHSFIGKLICQLLSLHGRECWSENILHAKTHTMKCWCPSWKKTWCDTSTCIVVHIWQLLIQASFPMSPVVTLNPFKIHLTLSSDFSPQFLHSFRQELILVNDVFPRRHLRLEVL